MMDLKKAQERSKWLVVLGAAVWAGCFAPEAEPLDDLNLKAEQEIQATRIQAVETQPIILFDHVYELPAELESEIRVYENRVSIPKTQASQMPSRAVGDVLYSDGESSFRLRITEILEDEDNLIFKGVTPDLTEVVKEGEFQVFIPPPEGYSEEPQIIEMGGGIDIAERAQGLLSGIGYSDEYELGSLSYYVDFSGDRRLSFEDASARIEMIHSSLKFDAGAIATFRISLGGLDIGLEAMGNLEAKMHWKIEASGLYAMNRNLKIPMGGAKTFEIGGMIGGQYTLEPFLNIQARVEGHGEGTYEQEVTVLGEASAGVTLENFKPVPHFRQQLHSVRDASGEGTVEADIRFGVDLGLTLYSGTSEGQKMAEAIPVSGNLLASARIAPPSCPYSVEFYLNSSVEVFSPSRFFHKRFDVFSADGDFTSIPGCMSDYTPGQCEVDEDCGVGQKCSSGMCEADADLIASLTWHEEVDLDLHMTMPGGAELSAPSPNGSTKGRLMEASCGGCEEVETAYRETIVYDGIDIGERFRLWVQNESGRHSGNDREGSIFYQLSFRHHDVYEETFHGEMSAAEGARSVEFQYTVPPSY